MRPFASDLLTLAACLTVAASLTCPTGWTPYRSSDGTEPHPSCFSLQAFTPGGAATVDAACAAVVPTSHAVSVQSAQGAVHSNHNLLSDLVFVLGPGGYALAGCSQSSTSAKGSGNTGIGWAWTDGTSATNLICLTPSGPSGCGSTAVWGVANYASGFATDPTAIVSLSANPLSQEPT